MFEKNFDYFTFCVLDVMFHPNPTFSHYWYILASALSGFGVNGVSWWSHHEQSLQTDLGEECLRMLSLPAVFLTLPQPGGGFQWSWVLRWHSRQVHNQSTLQREGMMCYSYSYFTPELSLWEWYGLPFLRLFHLQAMERNWFSSSISSSRALGECPSVPDISVPWSRLIMTSCDYNIVFYIQYSRMLIVSLTFLFFFPGITTAWSDTTMNL